MLPRTGRDRNVCINKPAERYSSRFHGSRDTQHKGDKWNRRYGSECDTLIAECGPALWIHGHVDESFEYALGNTTVVGNPRGYFAHGENPQFDPPRTIVIADSQSQAASCGQ